MCTSCENIHKLRSADVVSFNQNPLRKVFGISTSSKGEQTRAFWKQLHAVCGIVVPATAYQTKKGMRPIVQPDLDKFSQSIQSISRRLRKGDPSRKDKVNLLLALQQMALLPQKWNMEIRLKAVSGEEALQRKMKQDILDIVDRFQLRMGGAHHPREIPVGVWVFVRELSRANEAREFQKRPRFRRFSEWVCRRGSPAGDGPGGW
jgi:hypothetical protein